VGRERSSRFQRFQSIVLGAVASRPEVRQNIMVAGACSRSYFLMMDRKQTEQYKKGLGKAIAPRKHLVTYFSSQPPPQKFLAPPKIAPPVRDQPFNKGAFFGSHPTKTT
jgi:hypothetical protein